MVDTFVSRVRTRVPLLVAAVAAASLLSACGDGGSDASISSTPTPPAGNNQAPAITGTPLASVMAGTQYAFSPTATDADGDPLTFSISGKPSWATFNTSSGKLSGTPGAGDVGTYSNIVISVTDGTSTTTLASFGIDVVATATGSATLSWASPTQNTDGTPLSDLAGFKVYWGTSQGSYSSSVMLNNPGLTTYVVDQLTPATWYFAITAVNAQGLESSLSNVASKTVL